MLAQNRYLFVLIISIMLIFHSSFICRAMYVSSVFYKSIDIKRDTALGTHKYKISKPNDSIILIKLRKSKLLSKEGIVIKQSANNTDNIKTNKIDSSLKINGTNIKTAKSIDNIKMNISKIIAIPFQNTNLTEETPTPLFKQLSDRNSLSKIEFLNTIKDLNILKKEIYQKNIEQKKTNPIHWLLLLIAAILIIIVLALFIKEIFTLVLISIMLVALVLLLGFL